MSTVVGTWKEGGNLTLSEHVACIAAKHVGRYEDMIKELVVFFGGDTKKVEILKSCQERMRDVSNRFKEDRRAPRSGTNVPQLLNLAQELREKKKQFLIATQGEAQVEVTVGAVVRAGAAVQYLTPVKNLKTQRVKAPQSWRKKMLEKLLAPIFSTDDLTQEELAQLVGASRETVNKALADFVGRGWLRLDGRAVVILDLERLSKRGK